MIKLENHTLFNYKALNDILIFSDLDHYMQNYFNICIHKYVYSSLFLQNESPVLNF